MSNKKKLAFVLLAAGAALGVVAARDQTTRLAAERAAANSAAASAQARARLEAERHRLETRVLAAAQVKPLLAALGNKVDGTTLVDLFQSEDWWRDFRAEFPIARVVVGAEVLATWGSPDPGAIDRDVVKEARKSPVSSAVLQIKNRPYFFLASRLSVLPDRAPVLVLAKAVDGDLAGLSHRCSRSTVGQALRCRIPRGSHLPSARWLCSAHRFAVRPRRYRNRRHSREAAHEDTLKFGQTVPKHIAPDIGGIVARARQQVSPAKPEHAVLAPAPVAVPSTPAPAGPPRRKTVPGGVPVAEDGSPGQVFGRYQLLDRLGQGGMADVFTAVAHGVEGFSRVFVLKRLRPSCRRTRMPSRSSSTRRACSRTWFIRTSSRCSTFGRVGNEYFMTQEYIVGRDVVRLMARYYEHTQQTLTPRLAYYIAHETLQALQYAHTKRDREGRHLGIVHRDVSAGNIIMSAQGEVKLADFGIVKSNRRVSKTQMGMVKGNANFMSPEQARGQQRRRPQRSVLGGPGAVLLPDQQAVLRRRQRSGRPVQGRHGSHHRGLRHDSAVAITRERRARARAGPRPRRPLPERPGVRGRSGAPCRRRQGRCRPPDADAVRRRAAERSRLIPGPGRKEQSPCGFFT